MTAVLHAHKQRASERTCTLKVQKKRLLALQLTGALHDSKEHVNVGAGCGEMIERCLDLVILQSQTRDTESAGSLQLGLGCFQKEYWVTCLMQTGSPGAEGSCSVNAAI